MTVKSFLSVRIDDVSINDEEVKRVLKEIGESEKVIERNDYVVTEIPTKSVSRPNSPSQGSKYSSRFCNVYEGDIPESTQVVHSKINDTDGVGKIYLYVYDGDRISKEDQFWGDCGCRGSDVVREFSRKYNWKPFMSLNF